MDVYDLPMPNAALVPTTPSSDRAPYVLARLRRVVDRLIQTGSITEIADWRDKAELYARKARLSFEIRQDAAEAWIRLETRLGELLPDLIRKGRPKKVPDENHFRLADLQIDKKLSMRAQQMAAIPPRVRENYFRTAREAGWEITWIGPNGLQQRAAADIYEIARQRKPRSAAMGVTAPEHFSFDDPTSHEADFERRSKSLFVAANDTGWKIRSPKRRFLGDQKSAARPTIDIHLGDCLDILPQIADHSASLILADLPYGQGHVPWDQPLDLPVLWREYRRIIRPCCPILLFGAEPFTSTLVMSALDWFKFDIVWIKNRAANFVHANNRPLNFHQSILVFSQGGLVTESRSKRKMPYYPEHLSQEGYPRSYVEFDTETGYHPTQKPVPLLRYLIELFSRPGETVLDCCMGSGSTGVATLQAGRSFIGIEKHEPFFEIAKTRLRDAHTLVSATG
jgi:site-specific DNA-methyltransferase (adenine-specific)